MDTDDRLIYVFFGMALLFLKWSCSAAIASWKDFRTTAPTYFVMGNPFPIDLRVFEHSIDRFECVKVITRPLHNDEFSEILFIFIDLYWISLVFIQFHWFPMDFTELQVILGWASRQYAHVIDRWSAQTLVNRSEMDSPRKNTSELWCGSPSNSQ